MNRNKASKSQTLLYFLLTFLKEILLHFQSLFGRSNRDVFLENEGKIYRELADWHLATSLRINLFTDSFQGF